jgi:hypothetical protein
MAKSYEREKWGVKGFFDNKQLYFQRLTKTANSLEKVQKLGKSLMKRVEGQCFQTLTVTAAGSGG